MPIAPAREFREIYRQYLIDRLAGKNPSRKEVDRVRGRLPPNQGDTISFEIEKELELPATDPQKAN